MTKKQKFLYIKNAKLTLTPEQLCGTSPSKDTSRLLDFVTEVMSYTFDEAPNYNKLRFLLTKALIDFGTMPSKDYDWIDMLND